MTKANNKSVYFVNFVNLLYYISNEALRALLLPYKRIVLMQEMEVKNGTGTERITFVDFPGTGSDNRRDVYLCLNKLPKAHVNLLFFQVFKTYQVFSRKF